jgi:raffinose/stachyose/melibiose transport system permease protein
MSIQAISTSRSTPRSTLTSPDARRHLGRGVIRTLIILYVLTVVYPVLFVILTSLKSTTEFYSNIWGWPKVVAWSNYTEAWTTGGIGSAFGNSVLVVGSSLVFILLFSGVAAYALARLVPKSDLITLIILASTFIPGELVLVPEFLMASKLQIVGTDLGLIVSYIGWSLPMTIFIMRGFILTIPMDLIEAARIDGAGELRIFFQVVAPLMLPAVATTAIFNFIGLWGELLWAIVVLSTQSTIRTLPFAVVQFQGQFGTQWGPLSAAICIVIIPLVVVFIFLQKYFIRGLTDAAVKG